MYCNITVRDGQTSEELRSRLGIESISEARRKETLYVLVCSCGRKGDSGWVKLISVSVIVLYMTSGPPNNILKWKV